MKDLLKEMDIVTKILNVNVLYTRLCIQIHVYTPFKENNSSISIIVTTLKVPERASNCIKGTEVQVL